MDHYLTVLFLIIVAFLIWYLRGQICKRHEGEDNDQVDVESGVRRTGRRETRRYRRAASRSRSRDPRAAKTVKLEQAQVLDTSGNLILGLKGTTEFVDRWEYRGTRAEAEARATELGGYLTPTKHHPHSQTTGDRYFHYHPGSHAYILQPDGVLANYHINYGDPVRF